MKEFRIGCRTMRDGIIVSAVFLAAAVSMLVAGKFLVPPIAHLDTVVQALGGLLLLFVPFILVTTYLRTAHGDGGSAARPHAR
ncbi:MAG: hypothetical protein K9M02_13205 [Thiohalocapsa sp.]|jgi:hypothetical protein|nr:hypothetical protein [Thiohalocapsa sp.]